MNQFWKYNFSETDYILKELIGFARLCPGDTYEIQIKYGPASKFRARTKIGKDGNQTWDCSKFSFKTTIQDLLLIRVWVFFLAKKFYCFDKHKIK